MTHLFDTNAWLRSIGRTQELNTGVRGLIFDPARAPFALSAISIWEVGNKLRRRPGSLDLGLAFVDWLAVAAQPALVRVLPVDAEVGRLANDLAGTFHEDPADRFIVATAIHHRLVLVTSDEKILAYPHVISLDTR